MFQKSIAMKRKHRILADKHTATFAPAVISKWSELVRNWDKNHSSKDPYAEPEGGKSQYLS